MKKVLIGLTALAFATGVFVQSNVQAEEIILGLSIAKTGRYATLAKGTETSVDIAVEEINAAGGINGMQVRVVKFDTGGDPKQAVAAVSRLATDEGALAIIGPFDGSSPRSPPLVAWPVPREAASLPPCEVLPHSSVVGQGITHLRARV